MKDSTAKPPLELFFATQAQEWNERYERRTYRERLEVVRQIVRRELDHRGKKREAIELLDFGCGSGVLLKDLQKQRIRLTGVDTSRPMIEKARWQLGADSTHVQLEWLQNSSGEGAYEARSYDIVVCTSVLEFVPEMERLLEKICSRVRAGGILLISVPNRRSWLRKIEKFIYRHPHEFRFLPRLEHLVHPNSYLNYQQHQFTLEEVEQVVKRCGLQHEEHRFLVAPRVLGRLERSQTVGMMLMAVFRK